MGASRASRRAASSSAIACTSAAIADSSSGSLPSIAANAGAFPYPRSNNSRTAAIRSDALARGSFATSNRMSTIADGSVRSRTTDAIPFGRPEGLPDWPFCHGRRLLTDPPLIPLARSSRRCAADLRVPLMGDRVHRPVGQTGHAAHTNKQAVQTA